MILYNNISIGQCFFNIYSLPPSLLFSIGLDYFHDLNVDIETPWPLNLIIDDDSMKQYNKIFCFLLQIKHVLAKLHSMWSQIKYVLLKQNHTVKGSQTILLLMSVFIFIYFFYFYFYFYFFHLYLYFYLFHFYFVICTCSFFPFDCLSLDILLIFIFIYFRHEMIHFLHILQGYITNQLLNVSWEEFQKSLEKVFFFLFI